MNKFALADEVFALSHLIRGTVRRFWFHGLPIFLSFGRVELDSSYFWFKARWVTRVCARTGIVCTCKLPITQIINSFSFAITQKVFRNKYPVLRTYSICPRSSLRLSTGSYWVQDGTCFECFSASSVNVLRLAPAPKVPLFVFHDTGW